jgi:molybdenum cofactor guanylyltransferase
MKRHPEIFMRPVTPLLPPGAVLAVCGWSGSGKTTALRALIPRLVGDGLSVAAVKHDAHGIHVDPRGKDSDHLFEAGADVVLRGPEQSLVRSHGGNDGDLFGALASLLRRYDVVLVEGHKGTPLPKVWMESPDGRPCPEGTTGVLHVLPWGGDRVDRLERLVREWLPEAWREAPVCAGILVGGRSTRMGTPKQLLDWDGRPIVERTVEILATRAERVVFLGDGDVPAGCEEVPRIPDPPGLAGPLAGILGAMRWGPGATWIVAACDQPLVDVAALDWLLAQRHPGTWAVLPVGEHGPEPLLALYDARARGILEVMAAGGSLAPRDLAGHRRVATPALPAERRAAWLGVNTPAEYEERRRAHGDTAHAGDPE